MKIKDSLLLVKWAKAQPIKVGVLLLAIASVACIKNDLAAGLSVMVMTALAAFLFVRDSKSLMIAICLSLLPSARAAMVQPQNAGVGAGLIVIGGFGYGTFRIVRYCQRHYAKPTPCTNYPPCRLPSDEFTTAQLIPPHSCASLAEVRQERTFFTISGIAGESRLIIRPTADTLVDRDEWEDWLRSIGLNPWGQSSTPEGQAMVKAVGGHAWIYGDDLTSFTVERSADFQSWETVLEIEMPRGWTFEIQDSHDGPRMFYRVKEGE